MQENQALDTHGFVDKIFAPNRMECYPALLTAILGVVTCGLADYGHARLDRFEVAVITITWLVPITNAVLAARLWRRGLM